MKNFTITNRISFAFCLAILLVIPLVNQAQSVKRQCISSYGAIGLTDNIAFMQTAGQTFSTNSVSFNSNAVLPGFQQSSVFAVKTMNTELVAKIEFNVYPNPAASLLTLQSAGIIEDATIQVTSPDGKTLLVKKSIQFLTHQIDCSAWENGFYLITISDKDQNKATVKLTISK